jgi:hypothetical protein
MRQDPEKEFALSRRRLLGAGIGVGAMSLFSGLAGRAAAGANTGFHPAARAKNIIYIDLIGGASQIDLFDPKPELNKRDGQLCPDELFEGKRLAFIRDRPKLKGSAFKFSPHGESGTEISNLLPHFSGIVDEVAIVRSMHTDEFNHTPAQLQLVTGIGQFGRPSIGSWVDYGIGTENPDLPAFIALLSGRAQPAAGSAAWGSGMLPSRHQGIELRSDGAPILYLENPPGISREQQRRDIAVINQLNQMEYARTQDEEIRTRMAQYELAWRMQDTVPEAAAIQQESAAVQEGYGIGKDPSGFGRQCLLARRLVERGVRFVQIFDTGWDHHSAIDNYLPVKAREIDKAVSYLVLDLKERGLLEETLVVCATEFGRTPIVQSIDQSGQPAEPGRDHQRDAFSVWLAGGGVRPGITYGQTDELGHKIVQDPVHVHDLNATILHLLGLNHERLTFRSQGRDYRLTDVHGTVVDGLLA